MHIDPIPLLDAGEVNEFHQNQDPVKDVLSLAFWVVS